jgi:hypothetical protein
VTATGQESREPRVGGATIAAWRRRQEVYSAIPAVSNAEKPNGYHATADPAGVLSPDQIARNFAASQQAGLAAMISLAKADTSTSLRELDPPQPRYEPRHSPPDRAASAAPSRPVPAIAGPAPITAPAPVMDLPTVSEPEVPAISNLSANGTAASAQPRTSRTSNKLAHLPELLLIAILTAQAALSLRLVWSNTASTDEALYLWAGHLEWSHWLRGTSLPMFATYFSGAPVVYPPLGAVADSFGGLAGARILSLCFMLGATTLLWATTSRLFGKQAGFFAIILWAFLGPTLKLGAYATYDAMSLFLVMLAAWCATACSNKENGTGLVTGCAGALALANAVKYASAIFDPLVLGLAVLATWPQLGGKTAVRRGALLATCTFALLYLAVRFAGGHYATGVHQTTLTRVSGPNAPGVVLMHAALWVGPVAALALFGAALSVIRRRERHQAILLAFLAVAALLAPLEQARIHTLASLDKHSDFGAWFAAIAAGYVLSRVATWFRSNVWKVAITAVSTAAICATLIPAGMAQAQSLFREWPNATSFISTLRPLLAKAHGPLLVEVSPLAEYYLPSGQDWRRWSNTYSIQLLSGHSAGYSPGKVNTAGNPAVYADFIARGYFSLVALNFGATPALDRQLEVDLRRNPRYRIVARMWYSRELEPIWAYQGTR